MTVKEFLNNVRLQWKEIEILNERIEALDASTMLRAIRYDQCKVQSSPGNVTEDKITCLIDYKRELERMIERFTEDHRRAQHLISTIEDTRTRQVLEVYFLSIPPKSMFETAQEVNYSIKHTYRLYNNGLDILARNEDSRMEPQDIAV